MNAEGKKENWLLNPYTTSVIIGFILIIIVGVVFICYRRISKQFCEERLRTLEAVSSKVTISTYTRFDVQWTSLCYSIKILQSMEEKSEFNLFDELHTIEESLGFSEKDGMIYLFDDKGYYYGEKGKIGLWNDQKILQADEDYSLTVTSLPKYETHLGDFMVFFYRLDKPSVMDGITVTHVALVRDVAVFNNDLQIGDYGDVGSSYIIRKNGTRIYHRSDNEAFANVYNILKALDVCQFEHGITMEKIKQEIQLDRSGSAHFVWENGDYIMAYQPLNIDDWYAVYLVSLDSTSQDTKDFIFKTVLMIGGTGAILLVLCLILLLINNCCWRLRQQAINVQLRIAVEESKRASLAKSEFLSRMSHDIRTPLNGIMGMTEIAKRNIGSPEKVNSCLHKISSSSNHLMSLINDVLDMARIENSKIEIRCKPFYLKKTLQECIDVIEARMVEHDITFHYSDTRIIHNCINGDENYLKQILINILGNAVKFTPKGGTISFYATETEVNNSSCLYGFEIVDTGIGMSAEFLEHIFEAFSQESIGARTEYNGTGLGMSIVKKLVEQMNGDIKVESEKNKGSCFRIFLPFDIALEEHSVEREKRYSYDCHPMQGRILLAEDSLLNREIAEHLLKDAGFTFVSAENGEQAVELFSSSQPGEFSVILMDVMMPVMDGLEATRKIRAMNRPDAQIIPIIAMTANAYQEDKDKSLKAGINIHLTKPINPEELIRILSDLINTKTEDI